jgi:hypothetical protein
MNDHAPIFYQGVAKLTARDEVALAVFLKRCPGEHFNESTAPGFEAKVREAYAIADMFIANKPKEKK